MNLDVFQTASDNKAKLASECSEIVDKCLTETRTISHLLHPPLLDEAGLASAARWYVDGFSQRSGIKVNLNLPPKLHRMHRDVEAALLCGTRRSDECSSALGLFSGRCFPSSTEKQLRLEIKDDGRGIPQRRLRGLIEGSADAGVGLAGMRERMRELGGSLEIRSDRAGTSVIISIPVERASINSPQDGGSGRGISAE